MQEQQDGRDDEQQCEDDVRRSEDERVLKRVRESRLQVEPQQETGIVAAAIPAPIQSIQQHPGEERRIARIDECSSNALSPS